MSVFNSRRRKLLFGLLAAPALPGLLSACARQDPASEELAQQESTPQTAEASPTPTPEPPADEEAREELARTIDRIGEDFGGHVGIAVRDVETGWETGFNDSELFPQQSVSKLWVAIAALALADKGKLDLSQPVTITRDDLTLFHQPIRTKVLRNGMYTKTARSLIEEALIKSDNTANDSILRTVGGPEAVKAVLADKNIEGVRSGPDERTKQSAIAGLDWDQSYAIENRFFDARDNVPEARRKAAFETYLANPVDGARPAAITKVLARLARGDLLSAKSSEFLLDTLKDVRSGPRRLKGGAAPGWTIAHKTGTGQFYDTEQSGYNDVGIAFSPDGRAYAMAVMIARTKRPTLERMEMMQQVTRAVIAFEEERKAAIEAAVEQAEDQAGEGTLVESAGRAVVT